MKISSYYKSYGHKTNLLLSYKNFDKYDKIFISKVFDYTHIPDNIIELKNVEYGGTGFFFDKAPPLQYEIEHSKPDYHLYDEHIKIQQQKGVSDKSLFSYTHSSIGFTTRGCFRHCSFCCNRLYNKVQLASPIDEFLDNDKPYIILWDDNIFAFDGWKNVFNSLIGTGKRFQFKQGLDERLLNDEKCDILFNGSKWIGDYIFAFDNIKDSELIIDKMKLIRKYTNKRTIKFYVFCGFNHFNSNYDEKFWINDIEDIFKRINIISEYGFLPYIMRHKNFEKSIYRGMYINLARWCNQPNLFRKKTFREFCNMPGNISSLRYLIEFEIK